MTKQAAWSAFKCQSGTCIGPFFWRISIREARAAIPVPNGHSIKSLIQTPRAIRVHIYWGIVRDMIWWGKCGLQSQLRFLHLPPKVELDAKDMCWTTQYLLVPSNIPWSCLHSIQCQEALGELFCLDPRKSASQIDLLFGTLICLPGTLPFVLRTWLQHTCFDWWSACYENHPLKPKEVPISANAVEMYLEGWSPDWHSLRSICHPKVEFWCLWLMKSRCIWADGGRWDVTACGLWNTCAAMLPKGPKR